MAAFGTSALAFRLPSLLSIGAAAILLAVTFRPTLGREGAFAGALLMLGISGYAQSFQARGYAELQLCFGLGLFAWQKWREGDSPVYAGALLIVSLVGAVYSHYYGVLIAVAFGTAEIVLMWKEKSVRASSLGLFVVSALACAPLLPLASTASRFSGNFWTPVTLTAALSFYSDLLLPVTPWFVAILIVLALATVRATGDGRSPQRLTIGMTLVLAAAAALPLPFFLLARYGTGGFHPRYLPATGVAICLLSVALLAQIRMSGRTRATVLIVMPLLCLSLQAGRQVQNLRQQKSREVFTEALVRFQGEQTMPVVLADDGLFVELSFYDRQARLGNCYFVYGASDRGPSNVDRAIAGLAPLMHLRAQPFDAWRRSHRTFVYLSGSGGGAMVDRLLHERARLEYRWSDTLQMTYWLVEMTT